MSLGSIKFTPRINPLAPTTYGRWAFGIVWLASGCGVLSFGGTDGESSFLDGKSKTIRSETHDPPDGSSPNTSEDSETEPSSSSDTSELDAATPVEPIFVGEWVQALAPSECVADLSNPIAGCDPEVDSTWDLDCDGDGVPDHVAYDCDPANTERGMPFYGTYDCAPEDPSRAIWIAPDIDADGYLGSGEFNCSSPTLPPGYKRHVGEAAQDCDDAQPSVHPDAPETWGDGTDSDCNGADYPSCDALQGPNLMIATPELLSCAAGADLHFIEPAFCGALCRTQGTYYVVVVNSGESASPGVQITYSDDTGASGQTFIDAIEPGEASAPIAVPFEQATEITVIIQHDDCSIEDNTLQLTAGGDKVCLR